MMLEYPDEYIAEDNWDMWLVANVPALAKLWNSSSYDAYEMWKVLNNLTHAEYVREIFESGHIYRTPRPLIRRAMPDIMSSDLADVQPMTALAGKIFNITS